MAYAEVSIHIDRSPEEVFAFVADAENNPRWRSYVERTTWLDPDEPMRPGRRGRQVGRVLGRRMEFLAEIVDWDPPRYASFRVLQGPGSVRSFYRCEPDGGGCRLSGGAEGGLSGPLWRLVEPLFVRVMVRQTRADLRRLKAVMERGTEGQL